MLPQSMAQQGLPEEGYALPAFSLKDASGRTIRLWDYKQRRPVLVAFVHGLECACCRAWVHALAKRRALLDELRVVTLVVVSEAVERLDAMQAELGAVAIVIRDADHAVAARYLPGVTAGGSAEGHERLNMADAVRLPVGLYAADRYLHCLGRWFAEDADMLVSLDEPLGEIAFAMQEGCGCSLPAWPPR